MSRIRNFIKKILKSIIDKNKIYLILFIILFGILVSRIPHLKLNTDMLALLPENYESIKNLNILKKKYGGIGFFIVVVRTDDIEQGKKFVEAAVEKLYELGDQILYIDYKQPVDFFKERKLLYLDTDDLNKIKKRVTKKVKFEKKINNPFYLNLTNETYVLDLSDIESKYQTGDTDASTKIHEYYIGDNDKTIVMLVKPRGSASDIGFSIQLRDKIDKKIRELNPDQWDGNIKVEYTGRYNKRIQQNTQIQKDLKTTTILAFCLIIFLLIFYFRQVVPVILIAIPLVMSIICTFGMIQILIGGINIVTGFLVAILLGLGIDTGIHYMNRYLEERRNGNSVYDSLFIMISRVGKAVFVAITTTVIAFLTLTISEFKGFKEFGLIGGIGLIFNYIVMIIILPAGLIFTEKFKMIKHHRIPINISGKFYFLFSTLKRRIILVSIIIFILIIALLIGRNQGFEYNLKKVEGSNLPAYILEDEISEIFGISLTPAIIMAQNPAEEEKIYNIIENSISKKKDSTIHFVRTIFSYIPNNQEEKMKIIKDIKKEVNSKSLNFIKGKEREDLDELRALVNITPITRENIPWEIVRNFKGVDKNTSEIFMQVFPHVELAALDQVKKFAGELYSIEKHSDYNLSICGETIILADILNLIFSEGKYLLIIIASSILLIIVIATKDWKKSIVVASPLIIGISITVALLVLLKIKFNILNIVMIPIVVGMGIDNSFLIYFRLREEKWTNLQTVLEETGMGIMMSSWTTGIGFGALIIANHFGIKSIGWVAMLGILSCWIIATTLLPALLYRDKK